MPRLGVSVTLIQVSVALAQMLDVMATAVGAMDEDEARTTRRSSLLLVGGSPVLVALVLFSSWQVRTALFSANME